MKWLQWSSNDLKNGLGGVEVHARSLMRELNHLGVQCVISKDARDLEGSWDVVHTHGSQIPSLLRIKSLLKKKIWIHTLHGSTIERMRACKEWTWAGGYRAFCKEVEAVSLASGILSIHPKMNLYRLAQFLNKPIQICGNGWDASLKSADLPIELIQKINESNRCWAYIGRGWDTMKDSQSIMALLELDPTLKLVIAPGGGFADHPRIIKTGNLTSEQIRSLLNLVKGLVLSSVYEGLPLVVLEALALGVPVVCTDVGGISTLDPNLAGFFVVPNLGLGKNGIQLLDKMRKAESLKGSLMERSQHNQSLLMTWSDVAKRCLDFVSSKLI